MRLLASRTSIKCKCCSCDSRFWSWEGTTLALHHTKPLSKQSAKPLTANRFPPRLAAELPLLLLLLATLRHIVDLHLFRECLRTFSGGSHHFESNYIVELMTSLVENFIGTRLTSFLALPSVKNHMLPPFSRPSTRSLSRSDELGAGGPSSLRGKAQCERFPLGVYVLFQNRKGIYPIWRLFSKRIYIQINSGEVPKPLWRK